MWIVLRNICPNKPKIKIKKSKKVKLQCKKVTELGNLELGLPVHFAHPVTTRYGRTRGIKPYTRH